MRIVVLTGAGISAESGIATFRDSDGLWANYRIEDVCTPEALARDRETVLEFYDKRRKELLDTEPNAAHKALTELQNYFDVDIITQNIDDLHERGGNKDVLHLHGELRKLRSSLDELGTVEIEGWHHERNARHADGSLLRPYVVFFGEGVPMLERAIELTRHADLMLIVGTSLQVYPAASLVMYTKPEVPVWIVDPGNLHISNIPNPVTHIQEPASIGVPKVVKLLIEKYKDRSKP